MSSSLLKYPLRFTITLAIVQYIIKKIAYNKRNLISNWNSRLYAKCAKWSNVFAGILCESSSCGESTIKLLNMVSLPLLSLTTVKKRLRKSSASQNCINILTEKLIYYKKYIRTAYPYFSYWFYWCANSWTTFNKERLLGKAFLYLCMFHVEQSSWDLAEH